MGHMGGLVAGLQCTTVLGKSMASMQSRVQRQPSGSLHTSCVPQAEQYHQFHNGIGKVGVHLDSMLLFDCPGNPFFLCGIQRHKGPPITCTWHTGIHSPA